MCEWVGVCKGGRSLCSKREMIVGVIVLVCSFVREERGEGGRREGQGQGQK